MSAVVVVGGGIAGLVAARGLAARGAHVTVLEAADSPGGCVATHTVAGLTLDSGAEAFATRGGAVRALVDELGLGEAVVTPAASGAWVHLPDGAVRLPSAGLLGIPADLHAPEVRRAVGRVGVARARLDRVLPARIGLPPGPTTVADLVRARMGRRVLDRLVAPVVAGVYSSPPELADLDTVLPGIRTLVRSTGSLGAAVGSQRAAAPAGSSVASLAGGMYRLVGALAADLEARGVTLRTRTAVDSLTRVPGPTGDETWQVALAGGGRVSADTVVLAVPGPVAEHLLEPLVPEVLALAGPTPDVVLATLVVQAPALDRAPRGTGVLVAEGTPGVGAKALTHRTAKWAWLAEVAGPGRHVIRLSYGRGVAVPGPPGHLPPSGGSRSAQASARRLLRREPRERSRPAEVRDLSTSALAAQALTDASTLLETPLTEKQVVGFARIRWVGAVPAARTGHRDDVARLRSALESYPGLHATGAWLSGTGLAAVVADAQALAAALPLGPRG